MAREVLQEVAVVGRDLHGEVLLAQAEARHDHVDVVGGMLQPGVGKRREIRIVVAEDPLGRFEFLELDEEAALADARVQRIELLRRAELVRSQERVGDRGETEIAEGDPKGLAAGAAGRGAHAGSAW